MYRDVCDILRPKYIKHDDTAEHANRILGTKIRFYPFNALQFHFG